MQKEPGWPLTSVEANSPGALLKMTSVIKRADCLTIQDALHARIALLYTVRTARNLDAIAQLCRSGMATEAVGIIRAICEDAVALAYLADDPSARSDEWAAFAEARASSGAESGARPSGSAWWSGKSPTTMARELGDGHAIIRDEFPQLYWRLCDDTHGSPKSAIHYVVGAKDADAFPDMLVGPSNHQVVEMCALAAAGGLMLFQVAAQLGVSLDLASMTAHAAAATQPILSWSAKSSH